MEGHPHHHHHQISVNIDAGDRFPQWSIQETRDFLMIRAELDPTFMETKRNKLLWEVIATKMKEKGYSRSAEQCKCKWKNLVTRYKGCETMEPEGTRQQFPFYNELQTIFSARMQRMLWMEAEGGPSAPKRKAGVQLSSDDDEEDDDINEESDGHGGEKKLTSSSSIKIKRRKVVKGAVGNSSISSLKEVLEEFIKQQLKMEMEWMNACHRREEERRVKEMEWRQTMEALENERVAMEGRWREREEERRMREEARAEKRDALITALLNKLRRDEM